VVPRAPLLSTGAGGTDGELMIGALFASSCGSAGRRTALVGRQNVGARGVPARAAAYKGVKMESRGAKRRKRRRLELLRALAGIRSLEFKVRWRRHVDGRLGDALFVELSRTVEAVLIQLLIELFHCGEWAFINFGQLTADIVREKASREGIPHLGPQDICKGFHVYFNKLLVEAHQRQHWPLPEVSRPVVRTLDPPGYWRAPEERVLLGIWDGFEARTASLERGPALQAEVHAEMLDHMSRIQLVAADRGGDHSARIRRLLERDLALMRKAMAEIQAAASIEMVYSTLDAKKDVLRKRFAERSGCSESRVNICDELDMCACSAAARAADPRMARWTAKYPRPPKLDRRK
jgi:hypothetical protein